MPWYPLSAKVFTSTTMRPVARAASGHKLLAEMLEKRPDARPVCADALYERLEPFAVGLPMLPGFLAKSPSPGRMYARMVGRVLSG
ncbi:hypothetical protein [Nonomuraea cavernae]|uniref:hypothetical protein n=1 Tax=Nonomuraea cavernae TaxID=2045107 RepID=UPI00340039D5